MSKSDFKVEINGHEIDYNGKRPVTAAWIIEDLKGNLLRKGYSLDAIKARKAAESNREAAGWNLVKDTDLMYCRDTIHARGKKRTQARQHNEARAGFIRSNTRITIKHLMTIEETEIPK